eukprot:TRINITY_DN122_c0_g1_i1.p1 TRINITY_DN122_c0_g1~~TRINITY_DN122_c0_g1_i1.p1  ORF type:complete len:486 (+),score=123.78 TRINITY_DN122_c0_g1_i1:44-1501(+)
MDWFLGIAGLIGIGICVFVNIYFLQYYRHEEDKWSAFLPRFVIIVGLLFGECAILMLGFDLANNGSSTYPVPLMWQIIFGGIIVFVVILIPFTSSYYTSTDEKGESSIGSAIKTTVVTFIIFAVIILIGYPFLSYIDIETNFLISKPQTFNADTCINCISETEVMEIRPSFTIFAAAMFNFFGNVLFIVFGGIGMVSLPFSLINDWRRRPRPETRDTIIRKEKQLKKTAEELMERGEELKDIIPLNGKRSRKEERILRIFKAATEALEEDNRILLGTKEKFGLKPVQAFLKLILGVLFFIISALWVVHVVVYIFLKPPASEFLNVMFVQLDNFFPMLSYAVYTFFCVYLLWAVLHGVVKVGLQLFLFPVHKMKAGETPMNSILFNVGLLLLTVLPTIQFCLKSFASFSRGTSIQSLVSVQFGNLRFMKYMWDYYIVGFLLFMALALGISLLCPGKREDANLVKALAEIRKENKHMKEMKKVTSKY